MIKLLVEVFIGPLFIIVVLAITVACFRAFASKNYDKQRHHGWW